MNRSVTSERTNESHTSVSLLPVHRVEVTARRGHLDPLADSVLRQARQQGLTIDSVAVSRVYLIDAPLDDEAVSMIANDLLVDPVTQATTVGARDRSATGSASAAMIEVHYKPGVMDPVAQSTREAILEMFPDLSPDGIEVRTGWRYDVVGSDSMDIDPQSLRAFAEATLANTVIQDVYDQPYHPRSFTHGSPYVFEVVHVPIRDLDDPALLKLSRDGHLFLNLDEMRAIQTYYRGLSDGREPTDAELETLAQTWSEHCVHKTLKAAIHYQQDSTDRSPGPGDWAKRPGHTLHEDGSVTINNLLKSTIAAATQELMRDETLGGWCVSVFEDNAGIVRFDDEHGVCIKVETHNHPSAIEPYGGAATGIGGCIRDIMGTGLTAKPIANMDVFCVSRPDQESVPNGVIPPRRILERVVAGVRDYGNRMGIPTINGAVWFHDDYVANPLVFAGCVGLIPLDQCFGKAHDGDRIIVLGGRTGRDGIHGATFSSAELTDTHADEFAHAVQIGNPITQKKTLDVILQARDHRDGCLFNGITDCGAGGFSSAVGEMGQELGAAVTLETAPLKYPGLSYTEIWISEAQERMVLAVPQEHIDKLRRLCDDEDVEMCDLGRFGASDDSGQPQLVLTYHGSEVGRLSMDFLHDGLPTPTRRAVYAPPPKVAATDIQGPTPSIGSKADVTEILYRLLAHPNIASKHWIVRQYDHEVQGGSVVKPLVGPGQDGPGDAAVIRPKLASQRGVAIGCGLATGLGEKTQGGHGDSYWMALAAIDEAVRNVVCVGADPSQIAILDNFCWPGCDDPAQLASVVRAAQACYDGALAYRTPFVSGKDSLSNQFTTEDGQLITIPPTLLISALGIVPDVSRCVTMDAKAAGNALILVGRTGGELGGSHYQMVTSDMDCDPRIPHVDLTTGPRAAQAVAALIAKGLVASAHDCSDGGLLVAAAEMAFSGRVGLDLDLADLPTDGPDTFDLIAACFAESPGRYLLEIELRNLPEVLGAFEGDRVVHSNIGTWAGHDRLTVRLPESGCIVDEPLDRLRKTWLKPLDW